MRRLSDDATVVRLVGDDERASAVGRFLVQEGGTVLATSSPHAPNVILRQELQTGGARLRLEMRTMNIDLREQIQAGDSRLRENLRTIATGLTQKILRDNQKTRAYMRTLFKQRGSRRKKHARVS